VKKILALATALTVVLLLSVGPAAAQTVATPPVVVDRTAVTLTYQPSSLVLGASTFDVAVSYQFGPGPWDLLLNYVSPSGFVTNPTAFRIGGRYHLRPPSPTVDVFGTVGYFSPSTGNTRFELGGGFTDTVAPGLKLYYVATYNSQAIGATGAYISTNLGVQYEINRQFALVAGLEGVSGSGYVGINFDFSAR
jgi:hypothetical protein